MLEKLLTRIFELYDWEPEQIRALAQYWRILRRDLGKTAMTAFFEVRREVIDSDLSDLLELDLN